MHDNSILIDFRFSKSKLNTHIQEAFDLYADQKMSVEGLDINIKKSTEATIQVNARQKSIFAEVPVSFNIAKNAGLFSVEGEGSIVANVEIICDIDENFGLKTKTLLHGYRWSEGPILHAGILHIPAEMISNHIIHCMKEGLMEKLDKRLSETADIKKIIHQQMQQYATNYPVHKKPDLYFNGQLLQVESGLFREDEDDIHLDLWLEINAKISDEPVNFEVSTDPLFYWLDKKDKKNSQVVDVEFSYAGLSKMIMTQINGQELGGKKFEIASIHIRNTHSLEIKANMTSPIKSMVTITCLPSLNKTTQKLEIANLDIDIDASNIIYKLSSPIIEKIIRNKVMEMMPFDPAPYLNAFVNKVPPIQLMDNKISLLPTISQLLIRELRFQNQNVLCTLSLEDAEIDVVI